MSGSECRWVSLNRRALSAGGWKAIDHTIVSYHSMPMVVERWRIGSKAPLIIPFYADGSSNAAFTRTCGEGFDSETKHKCSSRALEKSFGMSSRKPLTALISLLFTVLSQRMSLDEEVPFWLFHDRALQRRSRKASC